MPQEPDHAEPDSPEFIASAGSDPIQQGSTRGDQPGMAPPAGAPSPKPVVKTPETKRQSTASILSSAILMIVGAAIAGGTVALYRVFEPPKPPGEVVDGASKPPADAVKPDDFKKLTDKVDGIKSDLDGLRQQTTSRPDFGPPIENLRSRLNEISGTLAEYPARLDSIGQKIDTVSQMKGADPSKIDDLAKRVADLGHTVDGLQGNQLRRSGATSSNPPSRVEDVNVEGMAMEQAVDLYNTKKYPQARDAFAKLQSVFPNDARIWYYSALANGFATNEWRGETERLVITGLDKEKMGQPDSAKVDAVFSNLTSATGKDWLAGYRKRIGAQ